MTTDEDVDAALAKALSASVSALGAAQIERMGLCHFRLRDGELVIDFYAAARIHEIVPSVAVLSSSGRERLSVGAIQEWLGEPLHAYMFNEANLGAACNRVAQFAEEVVKRYRRDPVSTRNEVRASALAMADRFRAAEIRQDANEAWALQDFQLARTLYEKMVDRLTPMERKRLDIAKKKLA